MLKLLRLASFVSVAAMSLTAADAADLIVEQPAPVGVINASGSWDGVYVGVFAGYGWGDYSDSVTTQLDVDGWLLGVNLGANFTLTDGIVAGVVGDIAWSDGYVVDVNNYSAATDWVGSVRGRIGFDGGAFMPYLTAGLAAASMTLSQGTPDTNTHIGWTAGAGLEFAATDNMSIDLLYRYSDYGSQTYNIGGNDYEASLTASQVSLGLNWSF